MIIVMKNDAREEEVAAMVDELNKKGMKVQINDGVQCTVLVSYLSFPRCCFAYFRANLIAPSLASAPILQKKPLSKAEFSTNIFANFT